MRAAPKAPCRNQTAAPTASAPSREAMPPPDKDETRKANRKPQGRGFPAKQRNFRPTVPSPALSGHLARTQEPRKPRPMDDFSPARKMAEFFPPDVVHRHPSRAGASPPRATPPATPPTPRLPCPSFFPSAKTAPPPSPNPRPRGRFHPCCHRQPPKPRNTPPAPHAGFAQVGNRC